MTIDDHRADDHRAVRSVARAGLVISAAVLLTSGIVACGDDPDAPPATAAAVAVVATGCGLIERRGDGLVVAPGRVLTVAHVVAGSDRVEVSTPFGTATAVVTVFDPANDIAVLAVDSAFAPAIPLGSAGANDRGVVVVYREGEPTIVQVRIARAVTVRTQDIYLDAIHDRPGYELEAEIIAGDSGGVVVIDHRAVAVVWARSRLSATRAWSVDALVVADQLASATPVDTGRCPN